MEASIDAVGRIVVPKPLRDALGLSAGSIVDVSLYGAGLAVVPGGRTARLTEEDGHLVALAAVDHDADLATCDARARTTYEAVGATVVLVPTVPAP